MTYFHECQRVLDGAYDTVEMRGMQWHGLARRSGGKSQVNNRTGNAHLSLNRCDMSGGCEPYRVGEMCAGKGQQDERDGREG